MKVQVTDPNLLSAVRPLDLASYLKSRGWRARQAHDERESIEWEKEVEGEHVEISAPRHNRWRDYTRYIRRALMELSQAEGRSELAILQDIGRSSRDVIRLRAVVEARGDGTIPLQDGALIARSARSLMLAAACSAHEPRRAYHSRKPPAANQYLNELSMGQTEVGSFVMTVLSPVPPVLQTTIALDKTPHPDSNFNRRVTQMLSSGLTAVRRAADACVAEGGIAPFEAAVQQGVSADLCEALSLVGDCSSVREFEVKIGWAPSRPELQDRIAEHHFTPDALEVIREAGRSLRERSPVEGFEVSGVVVSLDRPSDELFGHAIVVAPIDGRSRRIKVQVVGDDWNKTNDAMERRLLFRCHGELAKEGKSYVLRGPSEIHTGPAEEADD